ncbi:MAG TPA: Rho termination factor N-terminal domain-containing protein [Solirubrobacterales bacterium]|nr:Rho termination factor N-terminal domain-containing protein [Solirubrobacterales bacterium]
MTKTELESKHLAELHALAAEAGVPRYRMLRREELIEKLAGEASAEKPKERGESRPRRERKPRERTDGSRRRERPERRDRSERPERRDRSERPERRERAERPKPEPPAEAPEPTYEKSSEASDAGERRPRRRRRRRFGRKRKELSLHNLVAPGKERQTIVYAETREGCTKLLRELAVELAAESSGSDPVALLVEPGPEELAEWRRAAPQAEIVAAAQARHAEDAIAQATRRAEGGESVIVLIDSLTRLAELGDADDTTSLLDTARAVTVVAALEHH